MFTLIPASEIRALRDENPSNLATLCYKVGQGLDSTFPDPSFKLVQQIDVA